MFGSASDLLRKRYPQDTDTLIVACSEQGAAPDNISFASPGRLVILQHIAATLPSNRECEQYPGLSCREVEKLFTRYDFRNVIICGHLKCGVIRNWLQPMNEPYADIGAFRERFELGTRELVDVNYPSVSGTERCTLMICEHVLCQIENLASHPFMQKRLESGKTSFFGWVVDDESARVFSYCFAESAFVLV